MKMYAGAGKVDIQAQADAMNVSALQDINVASGQGSVKVNASKELISSCGSAYIKLSGGKTAPFYSLTPSNVKIEFPREQKDEGPGHWVTVDHDYHGLKNSAIMAINRLTSMGDEERIFNSEGTNSING